VAAPDRRQRIEAALRQRLDAAHVELIDESHLHAGHVGAAGGGGHFRALVVSPRFEGRGRVERQRLVHAALAAEMGREIHALSFRTLTPDEWSAERGAEPARAPTR
jgi:BolA protein